MKGKAWGVGMMLMIGAGGAAAERGQPELGWLAGRWCSEQGERRIDEFWLPEAGGALHGLSRTVSGGQVESFEFMHIVRSDGSTTFNAQPQGAAPTAFALIEQGAQHASFANAAHDFPNRIDYRRDGDRLRAEISGPGREGPMRIPFDYQRCD